MQAIRFAVVDKLLHNSSNLYPSFVDGGIYDRPLSRDKEGGTPAAFAPYPDDAVGVKRTRNSIVVFGPNEVEPVDGPREDSVVENVWGFLRVFMYVPATRDGKEDFDTIDQRCRKALGGYQFYVPTPTLRVCTITALPDLVDPIDSDEFENTLVGQRRYHAEWMRDAYR